MLFILQMMLVGLASGCLGGLFGVGGGTILIPAFVHLFKMPMHRAIGTSLAVIVVTAAFGAMRYHFSRMVDWRVVLVVSIASIGGVLFTSQVALGMNGGLLQKLFAIFLFVVAIHLFFKA